MADEMEQSFRHQSLNMVAFLQDKLAALESGKIYEEIESLKIENGFLKQKIRELEQELEYQNRMLEEVRS